MSFLPLVPMTISTSSNPLTSSKEREFLKFTERKGIEATVVGEFYETQNRVLVGADGTEKTFPRGNFDPYTLLLEK